MWDWGAVIRKKIKQNVRDYRMQMDTSSGFLYCSTISSRERVVSIVLGVHVTKN